ncbi:hypothetical protein D9M72_339290 [compost metagenome]
MRLGRGIGQRRFAFGGGRAQHEVLGGGHRGIVEPVVRGLQRAAAAHQQRAAGALHLAAERAEDVDVGIDLAHAQRAALDVVFEPRHAKAGQQRRHQHDRRAHFFRQPVRGGVESGVAVVQVERAGGFIEPDIAAQHAENIEDLADIGDVRHAVQAQRLVGQQRGAKHGQHCILVGRGDDAAAQGRATVDDEIGHGKAVGWRERQVR